MIIKEDINIKDDKLTRGLGPVVRIMSLIKEIEDEDLILDCSSIRFTSPVFIISLMLCLFSSRKKVSLINVPQYLKTIHFYEGLKPDIIDTEEFRRLLKKYCNKSYIPVISFPASVGRTADKDSILSAVENLLCRQLKLENNVLNGLKYMLGEMVDNITEHSDSERGYIFAQSYPTKEYVDLCIADEGITLKGSFKKAGIEVYEDIEAMQAANKGVSSKNLPNAENRGYGIYTTKNMLITGLQGQYMMMSGQALYLKDRNMDNVYKLPNGIRWNGTVIALRLPYKNKDFSYIEYVE